MDTLPSGVLLNGGFRSALICFQLSLSCPFRLLHTFPSLRPARHYSRFWIRRSSSERRRDFNPHEQRAAQHTLCPLLTSAARSGSPCDALSRDSATKQQISRGKFDRLPHTTAEFTTSTLDGYGLCCHWPARPAPYASYPVLVHRLVRLLHASFRPRLATTPLRFAMTSPPSGCQKDFHLRAVEHARHTTKKPPACTEGFVQFAKQMLIC